MQPAVLEHLNVTVPDIERTANLLCELFDWQVRWQGDSIYNGFSIHVGGPSSYIALYTPAGDAADAVDSYNTARGLNHVSVTVEALDTVEARVVAAGLEPHSHADYEPGQRFYFNLPNGLEVEVVSYV
ncbi:MAG: VOC family protein [Pseudomonadota bacterium]